MADVSKIVHAVPTELGEVRAPTMFAIFKEMTEGLYLTVDGKKVSESGGTTGHFLVGIATTGEEVKKIIQEDQKRVYPPEADLQPFDIPVIAPKDYRCMTSCRVSYRVLKVSLNDPIHHFLASHDTVM